MIRSLILNQSKTSPQTKLANRKPGSKSRVSPAYNLSTGVRNAIQTNNVEAIEAQIKEAQSMASNNLLKCKDFAMFFNAIMKTKDLERIEGGLLHLLEQFQTKLVRSDVFRSSMSPLDITQLIGGVSKIGQLKQCATRSKGIMRKLEDEVTLKLPLFEDHQLALVLHALGNFKHGSSHVVSEIIAEIEVNRDIDSFSLQSVVIIANAVSRLNLKLTPVVISLWDSIFNRASTCRFSEMQPNWPDVLLSSAAYSGLPSGQIRDDFIVGMARCVGQQYKSGFISRERVAKAVSALTKLGVGEDIISELRMHS